LWSAKAAESARVKFGEIIADNLSEAGWSWGLSINDQFQRANGLWLRMRTATTESALLCTPAKGSARLMNLNVRCLTVTFYLASVGGDSCQ
jgi:hypothetical protein